jgi:opacity protein-like surface antigen
MKKNNLFFYCFLVFFCCTIIVAQAQKYPKAKKVTTEKASKKDDDDDDDDPYNDEEEYQGDISWKQKGFEFYIGGGAYFAGKKTANYYNGAPENDINLHLLFNNKYRWEDILYNQLKPVYPSMDTMKLSEDYNTDSRYSIAMDISLGARYRFKKNWYFELSYSFRRASCENKFSFYNPDGVPGNKDNPPYSNWENLIAKEDRHYIDFSVGYIFQNSPIAKPFFSIGAQFNYINIKSFLVIIEGKPYDLLEIARYPDWIPGMQDMPSYRVWKGAGYGFSFTAGLKLAVNKSVSLDPVFQLSAGSFGNSRNLPDFNTNICFNYMVGVRVVINDVMLLKNK